MTRTQRKCLACVGLLVMGAVRADTLGRLFTSPAERAALTRLPATAVSTTSATPVPPASRFDGIVLRAGKPVVAWLNGKPMLPAATRERPVWQDGELSLPQLGQRLKPGQQARAPTP